MITIRKANIQDADTLVTLGKRTFYDTFAASNTKEDMDLYLNTNFTVAKLEDELKHIDNTFLLAEINYEAVGYIKFRPTSNPEGLDAENALEIERLYVRKDYLGKDVGRMLMQACLDTALSNHHDKVWLGVWEHNPRAIAFYEKFGFKTFGSHPFILGTDWQTDFLMQRNLR